MLSSATWLRSPLISLGGASMTLLLMLTFYSNLLTESEHTYGNKTAEVVPNDSGAAAVSQSPVAITESTTFLPDEYYLFSPDGTRIAKSECRKFIMVMAKRALKQLTKCIKELKKAHADKDEFMKRFGCASKCFMLTLGLIEPTGRLTRKSFNEFLDKSIPIRYHALAEPVVGECLDTFIPLMDPDEPYCVAYGDMFKCLQNSVDEKCRAPQKPGVQ